MPAELSICIHATCVDIAGNGVLIRGRSGSGKSDLALRILDEPGYGLSQSLQVARLVADDQVMVFRRREGLVAQAPETLRGLLEIRGIGILRAPRLHKSTLALIVDLADSKTIPRLPEFEESHEVLLGVDLPLIRIDPSQASAAARVRAAVVSLQVGLLPLVSIPST